MILDRITSLPRAPWHWWRGGRVATMSDVRSADRERFARFFRGMLERGVYLPPSAFESAFLSDAHGDEEIDRTLEAADEAMEGLR